MRAQLVVTLLFVREMHRYRSIRKKSRNQIWECWADKRGTSLMIRTHKKRDGSIKFADPDLGGSGVKIESTFFVYLGCGIRGRKNLDANVRCALKKGQPSDVLSAPGSEPGDIQSFDAVGSGERAFGQALTIGKELVQ